MTVTGTFSIVCNQCGLQQDFSPNDSNFEAKHSSERQMGEEIGHEWEETINCEGEECGNEIEIEYQVWEYPIGGFNHENIKITGAKQISKFDYSFHDPE